LTVDGGTLRIGPERRGPAAAHGGPVATPTDAMVVLGSAPGDRARALEALGPIADGLGMETDHAAGHVLDLLAQMIAAAAAELVDEVNAKPVYTIHDLLEGHRVKPESGVVVGGPALAIAPYLERALSFPVEVPPHSEVANAVGAAVASLSLEVNALADTAAGKLTIPKAGVNRSIDEDYTFEELKQETQAALEKLAAARDTVGDKLKIDVAQSESFSVIEGYSRAGYIHRLRLRVRPSILCEVRR
jgi:N-methylhydantoinase A